jgi:Ran GTPase-activating protein (RanGAP) involved in mRNA processing and transport
MSNTLFIEFLATIPVEDFCRALSATQIFLLRILSKKVKDVVDNMHLCINAEINLYYTLKSTKNKLILQNNIKSLQNINCFHKIVKLSLTGCDYFMDFMLALIEIKTLEHLYLNSNDFGNNYCKASTQELINVLKNINLKTLVLIGNRSIRSKDMKLLLEVLANTSLTSLDISYNVVREEGAKNLAKLLVYPHFSSLKELNISDNCIGIEGLQIVAKAIQNCTVSKGESRASITGCTSLTSLNLSHNCFEQEDENILSEILKNNTMLTTLNLTCKSRFVGWD